MSRIHMGDSNGDSNALSPTVVRQRPLTREHARNRRCATLLASLKQRVGGSIPSRRTIISSSQRHFRRIEEGACFGFLGRCCCCLLRLAGALGRDAGDPGGPRKTTFPVTSRRPHLGPSGGDPPSHQSWPSSYRSAYKSIRSDAGPHPNRRATGACEPGKSVEPS
jgi:hypothetical protein